MLLTVDSVYVYLFLFLNVLECACYIFKTITQEISV